VDKSEDASRSRCSIKPVEDDIALSVLTQANDEVQSTDNESPGMRQTKENRLGSDGNALSFQLGFGCGARGCARAATPILPTMTLASCLGRR
jgi:hypothetical protein